MAKNTRSDALTALAALIGAGLIIFPEPATTAVGSLVLLGALGLQASK
jgi:hypothetical protein